jgi:hypothetical protein
MQNENISRKLYYALVDVLKRTPAMVNMAYDIPTELGSNERWIRSLIDSLKIIDEELKVVEEKPRVKLTEREKLVPLCNEFASLSKEDREVVLARLHGLHEYHIRLDTDIKKEKENQT